MRQFVVLGHEAPLTPDFSLKDLPGTAGRLDILCRCVNSAFFLSHALRKDVRVLLVHGDKATIRLEGSELKYLNPDERSTASRLRDALETFQMTLGEEENRSSPGIYVSEKGLDEILDEYSSGSTVVTFHEDGDPAAEMEPPQDPLFVLSDHVEFTRDEKELLGERSDLTISLGPRALHSDHAIIVYHNYLDTEGYSEYRV